MGEAEVDRMEVGGGTMVSPRFPWNARGLRELRRSPRDPDQGEEKGEKQGSENPLRSPGGSVHEGSVAPEAWSGQGRGAEHDPATVRVDRTGRGRNSPSLPGRQCSATTASTALGKHAVAMKGR